MLGGLLNLLQGAVANANSDSESRNRNNTRIDFLEHQIRRVNTPTMHNRETNMKQNTAVNIHLHSHTHCNDSQHGSHRSANMGRQMQPPNPHQAIRGPPKYNQSQGLQRFNPGEKSFKPNYRSNAGNQPSGSFYPQARSFSQDATPVNYHQNNFRHSQQPFRQDGTQADKNWKQNNPGFKQQGIKQNSSDTAGHAQSQGRSGTKGNGGGSGKNGNNKEKVVIIKKTIIIKKK